MQLNYKIINWTLSLSWDYVSNAHHYKIMAMSQTFVYYTIGSTSDLIYDLPLNKYDSYIHFKIIAESVNNDFLIESNEIDVSLSDIERFQITALNGYRWTTLAFRSKWVYDLYKIYNKTWLIAETEDSIIELLHKITKKELNEIIVEWYIKKDDRYILWWVSEGVAKLPERKKSDYKISIVIPVYNSEVFLPRTVDSVLSSSMFDIEIILVDDGSSDNSLKVCKWYEKNFPCISVIHQKNQWVAIARNNWTKLVNWEYLAFIDSDDIVHPYMYENLFNTCKEEKTNIAIATTIIRNNVSEKELCLNMPNKKTDVVVYSYEEVIDNKHNKDNMYYVAVWNKIIKTEVAKKVEFPTEWPTKVVLYEDCAYTATLYSYIDKFALCKNAYYIYDKRKQNTVGSYSAMYKNESNDDIWKAFIYAYSYPIYNRCYKNQELSDYSNFKRLIESYDKFKEPSSMKTYWDEKLIELINKQKLYENNLIMRDEHLKCIVERLKF